MKLAAKKIEPSPAAAESPLLAHCRTLAAEEAKLRDGGGPAVRDLEGKALPQE